MNEFERDGLVFNVRDGGPPDGETVILLHGFPQDASSWQAVEPLLHEAGLRTLAPDQRGYSPAASPTRTRAYRLHELAADVLALADTAGADRFHIVGHDWGGAVAWALATRHPERVATNVVLSTPHPLALARALRTPAQAQKSWYMGVFQLPRLPERILAGRVPDILGRERVPDAERYGPRFATAASLRGPINWYRANSRLGADLFTHPVLSIRLWDTYLVGWNIAVKVLPSLRLSHCRPPLPAGASSPEWKITCCRSYPTTSFSRSSSSSP